MIECNDIPEYTTTMSNLSKNVDNIKHYNYNTSQYFSYTSTTDKVSQSVSHVTELHTSHRIS